MILRGLLVYAQKLAFFRVFQLVQSNSSRAQKKFCERVFELEPCHLMAGGSRVISKGNAKSIARASRFNENG